MAYLLPLRVKGVGTGHIEGLGSYIQRLAYSHGVSAGRLINDLQRKYASEINERVYKQPNIHSIGGLVTLVRPNTTTSSILRLLEIATSRKDLRSTTFLALSEALTRSTNTFSSHMRWCPSCMHEYKQYGSEGYYKLQWMVLGIKTCPIHRVNLIDKCPHCGNYQDRMGINPIIRHCSHCSKELGKLPANEGVQTKGDNTGADLLELIQEISVNPELSFPKDGVKNTINSLYSRAWNMGQENGLWSLIPRDECICIADGITPVSLVLARRTAHRLGMKLTELLHGDISHTSEVLSFDWFKPILDEFKPKKKKKCNNSKKILEKLLSYRNKYVNTPPSLSEISVNIGTSTGYLQYHFPTLCNEIIQEHKVYTQTVQHSRRLLARQKILEYLKDNPSSFSKKHALREIRGKNDISKNMLREEIEHVFSTIT